MRLISHPKLDQLFPPHFLLLYFFFSSQCILDHLFKQIYSIYLILNEKISRQISQSDRDGGIDIFKELLCLSFGLSGLYALHFWHRHKSGNQRSVLLSTEVMGSTPGRHLQITGVEKNPLGGKYESKEKKCCDETSFNILPIQGIKRKERKKNGVREDDGHTQTKSFWHQLVVSELEADGSTNLLTPSTLHREDTEIPSLVLHGKTDSLTKVPVSALDCNNFRKLILFIEAVLFCHVNRVLSSELWISNNQINRLIKRGVLEDTTKDVCL